MSADLDAILRRVASGELSPEEAEPLVLAATITPAEQDTPPSTPPWPVEPPAQRTVRLQVLEEGRVVVNLRIPVGLASLAGAVLPGLSGPNADRVREAIRGGVVGPIIEVRDEDGDGVIISTE